METCKGNSVVQDPSIPAPEIFKGKSVVQDPSIPEPEDIFKSKFSLHIDCIKTRNLEGASLLERYGCALLADGVRPPRYYVSISLEENVDDGRYWYKDTHDRYKSLEKKQLQWDCDGIWFKLDLMKIHATDLKLEVIRHYNGARNVRGDEVGTSDGTKVVGRARIPLWEFLQGNKTVEVERGDEKRSNCVQLGKVNGSVVPKAQGSEKKCRTLEELLGGEEKRSKRVRLVKMEGSDMFIQGILQVDMRVHKVVVRKRKRNRGKKQAAAIPKFTLRQRIY